MKHIIYLHLLIPLLLLGSTYNHGLAQEYTDDEIIMLNGEEKHGKVLEIGNDEIKFVHSGESLTYTLKKVDILKITFSSGRIEYINKPAAVSGSDMDERTASISSHHNKVAILPFAYIIDRQSAGEDITFQIQAEAFAFLNKHRGNLQLQDPTTTNALLIQAGVTGDNVRGYTMGEICNILDVEYIVQGSINQILESSSVSSSQGSSFSVESENDGSESRRIGDIKGRSSRYSSSTKKDSYETSITMNVFTDRGQSIYSDSHKSMWSEPDAYKITLRYLLKRTPLYTK